MSGTMRGEFEAGRLTREEYIEALEAEVARLHDAFEFARVQAVENAIQAYSFEMRLRRAGVRAHRLAEAVVGLRLMMSRNMHRAGAHPAGSGRASLQVIEGGER